MASRRMSRVQVCSMWNLFTKLILHGLFENDVYRIRHSGLVGVEKYYKSVPIQNYELLPKSFRDILVVTLPSDIGPLCHI
jgi:hypothetical protein